MPRLTHMIQKFNMDAFDAIRLASKTTQERLLQSSLPMFGPQSIGEFAFTNLVVSNRITGTVGVEDSKDLTAFIMNARARTNLPVPPMALDREKYRELWMEDDPRLRPTALEDAFWGWALTTIVTLVIGNRPAAQWPLSDLLRRGPQQTFEWYVDPAVHAQTNFIQRCGGIDEADLTDEHRAVSNSNLHLTECLAESIYEAMREESDDPSLRFDDLEPRAARALMLAAGAALRFAEVPRVYVVHARQHVSASVASLKESTLRLLDQLAVATGKHETEPAVWVHLEGFVRRDVC
jgi:hypothetical protein